MILFEVEAAILRDSAKYRVEMALDEEAAATLDNCNFGRRAAAAFHDIPWQT